jgi:hypothetical protein
VIANAIVLGGAFVGCPARQNAPVRDDLHMMPAPIATPPLPVMERIPHISEPVPENVPAAVQSPE